MTSAGHHQMNGHVDAGEGDGFDGQWRRNVTPSGSRGSGMVVRRRRGCGLGLGRKRGEEGCGIDHVGSVHDATFPMGSVKELRTLKKDGLFYIKELSSPCLCCPIVLLQLGEPLPFLSPKIQVLGAIPPRRIPTSIGSVRKWDTRPW